jgi:hypothetical protein
MLSYRRKRQLRNSLKFSAMGKQSQRVQAAKRMEGMEERIRELEEIAIQNLPHKEGDIKGVFQWTDWSSGKVRRWKIRIGDRADRMVMEYLDGRKTKSHGWTYHLTKLRKHLVGS